MAKKAKIDAKMKNKSTSPKKEENFNFDDIETRSDDENLNNHSEKLLKEFKTVEDQKNLQIIQMKKLFHDEQSKKEEASSRWASISTLQK